MADTQKIIENVVKDVTDKTLSNEDKAKKVVEDVKSEVTADDVKNVLNKLKK